MANSERRVKGKKPTLADIRTDIRRWSAEIPDVAWELLTDSQIPISNYSTSHLLPAKEPIKGIGKAQPVPHVTGHDIVETFLDRDGCVREKLVHFFSDDPDAGKREPDQILGETTEDRYRFAHGVVAEKLSLIKKRRARVSSPN